MEFGPKSLGTGRKRKLPDWMMPRGKRGRYNQSRPKGKGRRTRLSPRNQFINQLGGWSSNKRRATGAKEFEFTTLPKTAQVNVNNSQMTGTTELRLTPFQDFDDPNAVFRSFQKWKVKKVEVYANIDGVTNSNAPTFERVLFGLSKWRDNATPPSILHVDGAQAKIIHVPISATIGQLNELDIQRCACFYPPISIEGRNPTGTSSLSYLVDPWFDGRAATSVSYNTFVAQVSRSIASTQNQPIVFNVIYYFKVTFLARNPTFES